MYTLIVTNYSLERRVNGGYMRKYGEEMSSQRILFSESFRPFVFDSSRDLGLPHSTYSECQVPI